MDLYKMDFDGLSRQVERDMFYLSISYLYMLNLLGII